MAVAMVVEPRVSLHLLICRSGAIISEPCSYRTEMSWKKRLTASTSIGRYPNSSMMSRGYFFNRFNVWATCLWLWKSGGENLKDKKLCNTDKFVYANQG